MCACVFCVCVRGVLLLLACGCLLDLMLNVDCVDVVVGLCVLCVRGDDLLGRVACVFGIMKLGIRIRLSVIPGSRPVCVIPGLYSYVL